MRSGPWVVLLAATALALPARWLHNPRERTDRAIDEWGRRDYAAADRHLEQALELDGDTPRALFNSAPAGSAPDSGRRAAASLARSHGGGGGPQAQALRPEANHLATPTSPPATPPRPPTTIEAARGCARPPPAKHNLELARRSAEETGTPQPQGTRKRRLAGERGGAGNPQQDAGKTRREG